MGDLAKVKDLIKNGADYTQPGQTVRAWTPLHIACWGSHQPRHDRDIVEEILKAAKAAKKEQQVRDAKDALEQLTPLQLANERRSIYAVANVEDKDALDEKRNIDKICEWLEKGWSKD